MNYFPFDPDPYKSAVALDDKRLRRIFQEAVMTQAEVKRIRFPDAPNPYPKKMPMPKALMDWILGDEENHMWFEKWVAALLQCCLERWGRSRVYDWGAFDKYALPSDLRGAAPKQFVNLARSAAKGLDYTDIKDTHEAYREYVAYQWALVDKIPPVWTLHKPPVWRGL